MAHSYPPMMMQHHYYQGNFSLIYGQDGMAYHLENGMAYRLSDIMQRNPNIFQYGELMYGNNGYLYEFVNNRFYPLQQPHNLYVLQKQQKYY